MDPLLTLWRDPPLDLSLARGQLDLWRFSLARPLAEIERLACLLNEMERLRAARLLDRGKAHAFIASRGRLRTILARYLDQAPAALEFSFGPQGKPRLAGSCEASLCFNLSHSGDWGLLAVTAGSPVGVDIELIDDQVAYESLAVRFFSPEEKAALAQFSPVRRRRGFFRIWTRKEALLKGLGTGWSGRSTPLPYEDWSIRTLPVAPRMLGTVALRERLQVLRRITYRG